MRAINGATMKKALITGVTSQDGASLTELPLRKGNDVHGRLDASLMRSTGRRPGVTVREDLRSTFPDFFARHLAGIA